jgi:hypothetical protein
MKQIIGESPFNFLKMMAALLVAGCLAVMYYLAINMKSWVMHNPKRLELYYKHAKRFSETKKKDFLSAHAGFWLYQSYGINGGTPLKRIDRLELKGNGILWQVVEWDVKMPSGKEEKFYQIRTGYVEPYGTMGMDTMCDVYTIHQSFMTSHDTCFGGWNFIDLWVIRKEGDALVVSKRTYEPYRDEAVDFFPHGMLDLVGLGGGGSNKFFKKVTNGTPGAQMELLTSVQGVKNVDSAAVQTNALALPDCLDMNCLSDVVKKRLLDEFDGDIPRRFNIDSAVLFLERYAQPLFVYERFRTFPRPMPDTMRVSCHVKNDGSLDSIRFVRQHDVDKMLADDMALEMKTWHFPRIVMPLEVTYTFTMP